MSNWLDDTHKKLLSLPRWVTLSQIAQDTGLLVSWLSAFSGGKISDPGIQKVQKLHDYLSQLPVKLKPARLPFSEIHPIHHLSDSIGVYIIWANEKCVYVGTSGRMVKRVCDHKKNELIMSHNPTHVDFLYTDENESAEFLERVKIKSLQPIVNKKGK